MKKIQLLKGVFAIVDDEDYDKLNQYKWQLGDTGYACRFISSKNNKQTKIIMHREIIKTPKGKETDHKDGNRLNNQKANLRPCNHTQNMQNRLKGVNNTSGFKGVSKFSKWNSYRAQINISGKRVHLGSFKTAIEAARAYDHAAIINYGSFAKTNF